MKRRPITTHSVWIYYYRYKDTVIFTISLFVVVLSISGLLFWKLILPQLQKWFSIRAEVVATRERIQTIRENTLLLSQMDTNRLDEDLATVVTAYPSEKDFGGILDVISATSTRTSVSLDDYTFEVGKLASESAEEKKDGIDVNIVVKGTISQIQGFIRELQSKIPLSQIATIDVTSESSNIAIHFPFKGFPSLTLDDAEPIKQITTQQRNTITQLSSWKPTVQGVFQAPIPNTSPTPIQ